MIRGAVVFTLHTERDRGTFQSSLHPRAFAAVKVLSEVLMIDRSRIPFENETEA